MKQPRKEPRIRKRPREKRPPLTWDSFARLDRSAVLLMILFYCLIHWSIRTFIAPVYTVEEAEQILMGQTLQAGYEARQPPMLAWLVGLAARGVGFAPPVIFGVKYGLMFLGLAFYYLSARNVLVKPGVSAAAVAAWALTYTVGWAMHEDLLAAVGLMAALAVTLHALTRILTWRRNRDWLYLGLAIGAGMLTHHLYVIFPVAMAAGIATSPFFRNALNPVRIVFAVIIAGLVYAAYAFWAVTHGGELQRVMNEVADSWQVSPAWIARVQAGGISLVAALVELLLPMALFFLTLFWELWLPILYPVFPRRSTDEEQHEQAWRRLFARSAMIAMLICVVAAVVGVETFRVHWTLVVLIAAPIWLFSHVKRAGEFPIAIRAFAALAGMFVILVIGARFVEWRLDINRCDTCRAYTPFKEWAVDLERKGFRIQPGAFSQGTIVAADRFLGGNLKGAFPKARVLDASMGPSSFPAPEGVGLCLAVWTGSPRMPEQLYDYMVNELKAPPHDQGPEDFSRGSFALSSREARLYFQFVPRSELCR